MNRMWRTWGWAAPKTGSPKASWSPLCSLWDHLLQGKLAAPQRAPERSCRPAILEADPASLIEPSGDYSLSRHLDCTFQEHVKFFDKLTLRERCHTVSVPVPVEGASVACSLFIWFPEVHYRKQSMERPQRARAGLAELPSGNFCLRLSLDEGHFGCRGTPPPSDPGLHLKGRDLCLLSAAVSQLSQQGTFPTGTVYSRLLRTESERCRRRGGVSHGLSPARAALCIGHIHLLFWWLQHCWWLAPILFQFSNHIRIPWRSH